MPVQIVTRIRLNHKFVPIDSDFFSPHARTVLKNPLEGSIEFVWLGRSFLGNRYFDFIFDLWAYITDRMRDIRSGARVEINFPDQALKLIFERGGYFAILSVSDVKGSIIEQTKLPAEEVDQALLTESRLFFTRIQPFMRDVSGNTALYLERLSALENGIRNSGV